jgi:outer membrane protein assembly factor BamB
MRAAATLALLLFAGCETVAGPGYREGELEVVWQEPSGTITAPPLLADDLVIVRQVSGRVEARRRATGVVLWERELGISAATDPPVRAGHTVLVNGPELVALDLRTGSVRWSRASGVTLSTQAAASDGTTAYLPDVDAVFALDVATGDVRWRADLGGFASAPIIAGDLLLVNLRALEVLGAPLRAGEIVAVERVTGAIRWRAPMPAPAGFAAPSAFGTVDAERGVFLSRDGVLRALRLSDGAILWDQRVVSFGAPQPIIDGDVVLLPEEVGRVSARSLASGELRWSRDVRPPLAGVAVAPALSVRPCGARLCVFDGTVRVLTREGAPVATTLARFSAPPVIDEAGVAYGGAARVDLSGTRVLAVRIAGGVGATR